MARSVVDVGMELLRQQNASEGEGSSPDDEQMSEPETESGGEDEPASQEESGGEQEDDKVGSVLAGVVDRLDQLAAVLGGLMDRLGVGGSIPAPPKPDQYDAAQMKEA